GYLMAAGDEGQLVDEAVWDRLFFGPVDRDLQQLRADGTPRALQWLHFPLQEGTSWRFYGANLTAHRGQVPTPDGPVDGFLIRGASGRVRVEVDYAPGVGAVTHYAVLEAGDDGPSESLDLLGTGTASSWTWMERGAQAFAGAAVGDPLALNVSDPVRTLPVAAPQQFTVRAEDQAVVVWGLASAGSRGVVAPPAPAQPWRFDGAGPRQYSLAVLPAAQGTWTMTGLPGDASGWAYVQAQALRWVRGP
ncbi:MAG: hypothetical protein LC620_08185, partial [Halobacteriales archaeon]|nr:hypothetical protein [Halobacteriales archaeon]